MEYLHYYETLAAHDSAYNGSVYKKPWVAFENLNKTVSYNKKKRKVILTSASDEKPFDGTELTNNELTSVIVSGDGFVAGEGATYDITGYQILVGSSPNTFNYTLNAGTDASKYNIQTIYGTLTVTDEDVDPELVVTIIDQNEGNTYALNDTVTCDVTITNIYDEIKDITIETLPGILIDLNYLTNVPAGDIINSYAEYTISESDILRGYVEIPITVTIENGLTCTNSCTVETEAVRALGGINLEPFSSPLNNEFYQLGETILYKVLLQNEGNVSLTNIILEDDKDGNEITISSLSPGDIYTSETLEYVVTADDVANEEVIISWTGTGADPLGDNAEILSNSVAEPAG